MPSSSPARLALRLLVAAAVVGGGAYYLQARSKAATSTPAGGKKAVAVRAVPVLTSPAARRDVPIWLEGLGTVAAYQQVLVRAQVDGRLDRIAFTEGQTVKKGDLIAQIDPRPFQVQLQQAEGALARDRAQLKAGESNLNRYRKLNKQDLASTQQVDDQQGQVGQMQGAIRGDQAAINAARLNLDFARVRAPIDGVVGVRLVDAGNVVRATDQTGLVVITQLDPAAVLITLPQDDLPRLVAAMDRGAVTVEIWARDGAIKLAEGKLAVIDNQINQATATLKLKAVAPNPKRLLWPNQFVKARLLVDTRSNALVVPAPAVQRGPQGTYVYVATRDGVAEVRKVDVSLITAELAVIEPAPAAPAVALAGATAPAGAGGAAGKEPARGLVEGDEVVTEGQNQLRPGAKLMKRPSAGEGGAARARPEAGARRGKGGRSEAAGKQP